MHVIVGINFVHHVYNINSRSLLRAGLNPKKEKRARLALREFQPCSEKLISGHEIIPSARISPPSTQGVTEDSQSLYFETDKLYQRCNVIIHGTAGQIFYWSNIVWLRYASACNNRLAVTFEKGFVVKEHSVIVHHEKHHPALCMHC
jgi:hypothetical protein